jgi:hypothetical protein
MPPEGVDDDPPDEPPEDDDDPDEELPPLQAAESAITAHKQLRSMN